MKFKKLIFFSVIIILLVFLGVFLWKMYENKFNSEKEIIWKTENIGDYEIKETSDSKVIENKKYGLVISVSNQWVIKNYNEDGVGIFSPEIEFDEYGSFLKSAKEKGGCIISIAIVKTKKVDSDLMTSTENLMLLMEMIKKDSITVQKEDTKYEIITIDGKEGVKTTFLQEEMEKYITVDIPINNVIYSFTNGIIFSEKCIQEFDKILKTVQINE